MPPDSLLRVEQISKRYLQDVSFTLDRGRLLGLVGASGSGKSTLARALALVEPPDSGRIWFEGSDLWLNPALRPRIQLISQQPAASLNPRFTAAEIVSEPLAVGHALACPPGLPLAYGRGSGRSRDREGGPHGPRGATKGDEDALAGGSGISNLGRVFNGAVANSWLGRDRSLAARWMAAVGLPPTALDKPALHFSGGERQRLAIARALILEPSLLILDESFAGLDLSVQGQVARLLRELRQQRGLACILITHDLALAASLADEIAVLDAGRLVETGPAAELVAHPRHPRTRELLDAALALSLPEPAP